MSPNMKALRVLSVTLTGMVIFVFFILPLSHYDVSPHKFFKAISLQNLDFPRLIGVLLIIFMLSIPILAKMFPRLNVFTRPLWGFREQNGRMIDTSIEKHPRLILALFGIIFCAVIFIFFI